MDHFRKERVTSHSIDLITGAPFRADADLDPANNRGMTGTLAVESRLIFVRGRSQADIFSIRSKRASLPRMVDAVPRPPDAPVSRTMRLNRARGRRRAGGARPGGAAGCTQARPVGDAVLGDAPVPLAKATRNSMRARCDPRQRWIPRRSRGGGSTSRSNSTTSARSWIRSSVFADPSRHTTWLPALRGQPPSSRSSVTMRGTNGTGDSKRNSSSIAAGMIAGSSTMRPPVLSLSGEPCVEASEAVGHGVEPGHDHELADAKQFLAGQGPPIDLGVDEVCE